MSSFDVYKSMQIKTFHNSKRARFHSNCKRLYYNASLVEQFGHVLTIQFRDECEVGLWTDRHFCPVRCGSITQRSSATVWPANNRQRKVGQEIIKFFQTKAIVCQMSVAGVVVVGLDERQPPLDCVQCALRAGCWRTMMMVQLKPQQLDEIKGTSRAGRL